MDLFKSDPSVQSHIPALKAIVGPDCQVLEDSAEASFQEYAKRWRLQRLLCCPEKKKIFKRSFNGRSNHRSPSLQRVVAAVNGQLLAAVVLLLT